MYTEYNLVLSDYIFPKKTELTPYPVQSLKHAWEYMVTTDDILAKKIELTFFSVKVKRALNTSWFFLRTFHPRWQTELDTPPSKRQSVQRENHFSVALADESLLKTD